MDARRSLLEAADRNFLVAWRAIVELAPRPRIRDLGDVLLLSSGEPIALFNPAYVLRRPDDQAETVERIVTHYAELGLPFAVYFRDEVCPGVADAATARGLVEHWRPPLMILDPIPATPHEPPPPELTLRQLDAADVDAYLSVLSEGFEMPLELAERVLGRALMEAPGFTGILGLVDGDPVAVSGIFLAEGLAGVYNVATLPGRRGRGYGAAVTWEAALIGRQQGAARSILQSSEAGEPVYRRMGFSTAARYRQFEGPPVP